MKKFLVLILTFAIGIIAFNLFKLSQQSSIPAIAPAKKQFVIIESSPKTPDVQNTIIPFESLESAKPFFESFKINAYDENDNYQGYNGWFIADDFKGMNEVWTILLDRSSENSGDNKLIWSAMVLTLNTDDSSNDTDKFHSVWIKTEKDKFSFTTNKIRGTQYKFSGKFFKNGNKFSQNEKVLKGTMQKIIKGKRVAKFTADFAFHEPTCFH